MVLELLVRSRYASKAAVIYYSLTVPAIVSEVVFSAAIASNPAQIIPQILTWGPVALQLVQLLPWVVFIISLYAVLSFRPSTLIGLLTISFFISATVTSQMSLLGNTIDLSEAVALVVVSSFAALIGFNYSRAAKVSAGRELRVESKGPPGYQFLSVGLELLVPFLAALALVIFVSGVVATMKTQASLLPEPLSTLSSLYLKTRVGTVFTTVAVAGATIWILRELLEPLILYFTITREDAIKMAMSQVDDIAKKVKGDAAARPSGGLAWFAFTIVLGLGLIVSFALFFGPQRVYGDLLSVLGMGRPTSIPFDSNISSSARNLVNRVDVVEARAEDFIRTVIRLLWG